MAAAVSQYLGAALAVTLFSRVAAAGVAMLRVVSAAIVLLAWRRPRLRRAPAEWLLVGAFGAALASMNLAFYEAIDRIPVGTAVAIEFAGPVTVAALGSRRTRDWCALLTAAAGVVLVANVHVAHGGLGVGLAALAGTFWAVYIVLGHRVARAEGGLDALSLAMVIGALVIAPVAAAPAAAAFASAQLLGAVVGVGLLSSVVPYALDQVTLRRLPRHRFALALALLPATAAIVGSVVLGQLPTASEVAGIALVMASLALTQGRRSVAAEPAVAAEPGG